MQAEYLSASRDGGGRWRSTPRRPTGDAVEGVRRVRVDVRVVQLHGAGHTDARQPRLVGRVVDLEQPIAARVVSSGNQVALARRDLDRGVLEIVGPRIADDLRR